MEEQPFDHSQNNAQERANRISLFHLPYTDGAEDSKETALGTFLASGFHMVEESETIEDIVIKIRANLIGRFVCVFRYNSQYSAVELPIREDLKARYVSQTGVEMLLAIQSKASECVFLVTRTQAQRRLKLEMYEIQLEKCESRDALSVQSYLEEQGYKKY